MVLLWINTSFKYGVLAGSCCQGCRSSDHAIWIKYKKVNKLKMMNPFHSLDSKENRQWLKIWCLTTFWGLQNFTNLGIEG